MRNNGIGLSARWVSPFGDLRVKGCQSPHRSLSQTCRVLHRLLESRHPPYALKFPVGKFKNRNLVFLNYKIFLSLPLKIQKQLLWGLNVYPCPPAGRSPKKVRLWILSGNYFVFHNSKCFTLNYKIKFHFVIQSFLPAIQLSMNQSSGKSSCWAVIPLRLSSLLIVFARLRSDPASIVHRPSSRAKRSDPASLKNKITAYKAAK